MKFSLDLQVDLLRIVLIKYKEHEELLTMVLNKYWTTIRVQGNINKVKEKDWILKRDQHGFYGVAVSTLDFESSDPSSNLGRTCYVFFSF